MKKNTKSESGAFRLRVLLAFVICTLGVCLMLMGFGAFTGSSALAQGARVKDTPPDAASKQAQRVGNISVPAYHFDVSPPLRSVIPWPVAAKEREREANLNPKIPHQHVDAPDPVIQNARASMLALLEPRIPSPIRNFDGIPFPGVGCNCAPPDTNGAVGTTQYVQMVNEAFQVFDKASGTSLLGPNSISSVWTGFGGNCETNGNGDPIVLWDRFSNRWLISQFAGTSVPTDQCIAISTSADATGSWNRYGFVLGTNFFDYPHLGVWPDGYYMADNVFNTAGTAFLGTQVFVFDRAKMIAGLAATFQTPGLTPGGAANEALLPADFDGTILPTSGAPATFVEFPDGGNGNTYKLWHYHVDWTTPANSTFTVFASPAAAAYTALCPSTRACVPNLGAGTMDAIGDRLMHRLAYRKFSDGHEAVVGNYTVSAGGVAGIRWFELRNVTAGPVTVFQESTYQPDTTWRWMGSAAMDKDGNMALGFSASSATINPQVRYAGRFATDPINVLAQGEATLYSGAGSPTGSANRWGDYSALAVDPVDDQTFWFTTEYYDVTGSQFAWKTRIGSFKFSTVPTNNVIKGGSYVVSAGANGVLDPGETVTVALGVVNSGGPGVICTSSGMTGTLSAGGGVTMPPGAQTYGSICSSGGPTVYKKFTFVVDPALACGANVTATLTVADGMTTYGPFTYTFTTGSTVSSGVQNFDGVVAPALPAGWTTTFSGTGTAVATSTTFPDTAPNDIFLSEATNIGLSEVTSAPIAITGPGQKLSFRNLYNTESTYDGLVLEISIPTVNAGAFQDILAAGGTFASGGYNSTLSTGFGNPLPGRMAWTGLSGGTAAAPTYITTVVNLPAAAAGQNVQFKWRQGSDNSVAPSTNPGSRIDSITLTGLTCGGSAPTATSVVSRHVHAGTPYDIPIPLGGGGVENRRGSGASLNNHQLVLTFGSPVTYSGATVASNDGLATITPSVSGSTVTLDLTAVADQQLLGVTLTNANDGLGNVGNINIPFGILLGDVNGNGVVNGADTTQVRARSGSSTDATNFRYDVNEDGAISSADTTIVRGRAGNSIPTAPESAK